MTQMEIMMEPNRSCSNSVFQCLGLSALMVHLAVTAVQVGVVCSLIGGSTMMQDLQVVFFSSISEPERTT